MKVLTTFRMKSTLTKQLLDQFSELDSSFQPTIKEAEEELPTAEILITYGEDLHEEHIRKAEKLKWIMVFSAGIEKLPFEAIQQRGILVTNARGISKTPMAEYTIAMMLQVARQSKQIIENEKNEIWDRKLQMTEITGQTITILGTGSIGSEIARLSKAFQMKTIGINRSGRQVDYFDEIYSVDVMDKALQQGDFIICVVPSTPDTYHLLKKEHFKMMKNSAVFINIGRGTIVQEAVLMEALKEEELHHAVLDVFENEPLPSSHPLWNMENVTITPHISGLSPQYQPRSYEIFEHNLKQYLSGENNFLNKIDLERRY